MTDDSDLRHDLDALSERTASGLPSLPHVVARARFEQRQPRTWKEMVMTTATSATTRPWVVPAAVTVVMAIVLLAVPISYQRTTGHEVKLTLSGEGLDGARVASISGELKTALHAQSVVATRTGDDGAGALTLTATVKGGSAADAQVVASTFAKSLEAKGYHATSGVAPIREKVSNSMVAYAMDNLIRIPVDNKSAAELEAEIRSQLAAAGIPDAQVSVTDEVVNGKPARKYKVEVNREHTATGANAGTEFDAKVEGEPKIVLTKDGQVLPEMGGGVTMRIMKKKAADGSTTMVLETTQNGQTYKAEIPNSETLGDAALAQAIETELQRAGARVRVTMVNGRPDIQPLP
jgi:hypothetical protein